MGGEGEHKGKLVRPLKSSIELVSEPWFWGTGIPIAACPEADLVVKKCVGFFGKVTSYDAPMDLT